MPQRSNEFQELVALIERALAPKGAKITESAMVDGSVPGHRREIDVLIESDVGPYRMKIAVEAKDEKRKMDLPKYESISGKYSVASGVKVDRVVIVSHSGFSKAVRAQAARENIQLLTLKEAMKSDWAEKAPKQLIFAIEPHVAIVNIEPKVEILEPGMLARAGRIVCKSCGRDKGTPVQWAERLLHDADQMLDLRVAASKARGSVCRQAKWTVTNHELRFRGSQFPFDAITAHFHCTVGRSGVTTKSYDHDGQVVNHFTANAAGKTIQMAMSDDEHPHQIALRIGDAVKITGETTVEPLKFEPLVRPLILPPPAGLMAALGHLLEGLDAKLEENAAIHDFAKGEDFDVDVLIRLYLGGDMCTRTAIVVHRGVEPVTVEMLRRWQAICQSAYLDAIVVMSSAGFDAEALGFQSSAVRRCNGVVPSDDQLLELIAPPLTAIEVEFWALDIDMFSSSPKKLTPQNEDVLRLDDRAELGLSLLADRVMERIFHGIVGKLAGVQRPIQTYRDYYTEFEVPLPEKMELVTTDGHKRQIGCLRGRADFSALVVNLNRVESVRSENIAALRFLSNDAAYPVLYSAYLPREERLELSEGSSDLKSEAVKMVLPEEMLQNLVFPTPANQLASAKSNVYTAGNIRMNIDGPEGKRILAIISLNRARTLSPMSSG